MSSVDKILVDICEEVMKNVPDRENEIIRIKFFALNKMIEDCCEYEKNSKIISFDGGDIALKIKNLREKMYELSAEKGAWRGGQIDIFLNDGVFKTHFDYEKKPDFKYTPSDEKFLDDIKTFPREENLIPHWLKDILKNIK